MKIYVDENKGDRNSFYLLAYVYGEDSDISSFQQAASVVKAHHPRLGSSFKGIHANKIDVSKRAVIAYVQDILNLFQQYLSQNKLHYFIFIQSTQKVIKNFGTVKNYLNNIIQGIRKSQFPDLQDKDIPNIVESAAQLWGIFQYPERFKNTSAADIYVDSCGAILNYATQTRTMIDQQGRSMTVPFYNMINVFMRTVASVVGKINNKQKISLNSYNAIPDTSDICIQICDILSNYLFNALRAEKGNTNANIIYKKNQIVNLLGINPINLTSLASNFDNSVNCINHNAFMIFED